MGPREIQLHGKAVVFVRTSSRQRPGIRGSRKDAFGPGGNEQLRQAYECAVES